MYTIYLTQTYFILFIQTFIPAHIIYNLINPVKLLVFIISITILLIFPALKKSVDARAYFTSATILWLLLNQLGYKNVGDLELCTRSLVYIVSFALLGVRAYFFILSED